MKRTQIGSGRRGCQAGFTHVPIAGVTLVALLMLVAAANIMAGRAMETWDSQVRHELEQELIHRGEQYKFAIEQFYNTHRRPPTKLEDLCPESSANRRYIRRCWDDPLTNEPFHLIRNGQQGKRRKTEEAALLQEEEDELQGGFGNRRTRGKDAVEGPRLSDIDYVLPGQESRTEEGQAFPFMGVASNIKYDPDRPAFSEYMDTDVYRWWEFTADVQQSARANRGSRNRRNRGGPQNGNIGSGGASGRSQNRSVGGRSGGGGGTAGRSGASGAGSAGGSRQRP